MTVIDSHSHITAQAGVFAYQAGTPRTLYPLLKEAAQ